MSGNNPWSEHERGLPERGYEPASTGARDPESDPQSPQDLFDAVFAPAPAPTPDEPSHDVFVIDEAQRPFLDGTTPSARVEAPAAAPAPSEGSIPGLNFSEPPPERKGRIALIVSLGVTAVVLCVGALVFGITQFGSFLSSKPTAEPAPTETVEPVTPEAPISALSLDLSKDFAFAADIPLDSTSTVSLKNVSLALDGNPEWTREEAEGITTYKNTNGCVVNWSQKDQDFEDGVTDFEASYEALTGVTGGTDFTATEYGYWTESAGTAPTGKTEVVEARVDQDGKAVVVAARAVVATGEVGLIWMSCEDPGVLDRFVSDTRLDVGFILSGLLL